jgi:nitrite reductase/ring-hydroxylating ferredoxin subunit
VGEHVVGRFDELRDDRGVVVEVDGREVGLFRVGSEVYALRNQCPHQGGPVGTGGVFPTTRAEVRNGRLEESLDHECLVVVCPWHGWEFELESGVCTADRARRLAAYPAFVRDGDVLVVLPDA